MSTKPFEFTPQGIRDQTVWVEQQLKEREQAQKEANEALERVLAEKKLTETAQIERDETLRQLEELQRQIK